MTGYAAAFFAGATLVSARFEHWTLTTFGLAAAVGFFTYWCTVEAPRSRMRRRAEIIGWVREAFAEARHATEEDIQRQIEERVRCGS